MPFNHPKVPGPPAGELFQSFNYYTAQYFSGLVESLPTPPQWSSLGSYDGPDFLLIVYFFACVFSYC